MLLPGARTFHLVVRSLPSVVAAKERPAALSRWGLGLPVPGGSGLQLGFRMFWKIGVWLSYSDGLECRCRQLYEAVVPDDLDSDEDARLRGSRDRGKFCLTILSVVVAFISLIVNKRRAA